jgi:hypothetical protein
VFSAADPRFTHQQKLAAAHTRRSQWRCGDSPSLLPCCCWHVSCDKGDIVCSRSANAMAGCGHRALTSLPATAAARAGAAARPAAAQAPAPDAAAGIPDISAIPPACVSTGASLQVRMAQSDCLPLGAVLAHAGRTVCLTVAAVATAADALPLFALAACATTVLSSFLFLSNLCIPLRAASLLLLSQLLHCRPSVAPPLLRHRPSSTSHLAPSLPQAASAQTRSRRTLHRPSHQAQRESLGSLLLCRFALTVAWYVVFSCSVAVCQCASQWRGAPA